MVPKPELIVCLITRAKWDIPDWREMTNQTDCLAKKWLASRKVCSVEELETLPVGTKPRTSHHRSLGGERRGKRLWSARRSSLKGREGNRQSDEHWNCFKANNGEISERGSGAHTVFSERIYTIFNWTKLSLLNRKNSISNKAWWYSQKIKVSAYSFILKIRIAKSTMHVFMVYWQ